jgi:hypothetical protein
MTRENVARQAKARGGYWPSTVCMLFVVSWFTPACYLSRGMTISMPDGASEDLSSDSGIDAILHDSPYESADSVQDIDADGGDGIIVPEGTPQPYPTDTGETVEPLPRCDDGECVAFSGEVYGLLLMDDSAWNEDVEFAGIYRLAPGGTYLGTSWVDRVNSNPDSIDICWTGEVFAATFLLNGTIIRVVSVDEDGVPVRPPEDIVTERHGAGHLLCPNVGPFIVEHFFTDGSPTKIYDMDMSGALSGRYTEVVLPELNGFECTETESEAACLHENEPKIVYFNKEGEYRSSDLLPVEVEGRYGCNLVRTDGGVGIVWINETESGKRYLMYAGFDLEGAVEVAPVQVMQAEDAARAGSSGSTIFVYIGLGRWPDMLLPNVILIDIDGNTLDGPVAVPDTNEFNPSLGIFWEGDAYGAMWENRRENLIYYQRFLINL